MSNPVLLSAPYRFYKASIFVHGAEHLFICPFIHPANLSHSSPHPYFKGVQTIYLFFSHGPCLTSIQNYRHTSVLTNLFLRSTLILLVSSSFLVLNASFAIPILVLTSSTHLPSSEINEPRYLNLLPCFSLP